MIIQLTWSDANEDREQEDKFESAHFADAFCVYENYESTRIIIKEIQTPKLIYCFFF